MCNNFIEKFTDKVIEKINYEKCSESRYKLFDENLIKYVQIYYDPSIDVTFYIDLSIYYFHKDVKRFVDILKKLNIDNKFIIITQIANEIKKNHKNCSPLDNNTIVFPIYDNISWNELGYIKAEYKDDYYGEKEKLNFNSWFKVFLKYFAD